MNSPQRMQQIQEIFHATLERKLEERDTFLQRACADDPALQNEVAALLAAHADADSFLQAPAYEPATQHQAETATQIQMTPVRRTVSHYEILSLLGKGGMGEVYLAADQSLGRKAALKILPARYTTDADLVHRFEREAKAASALNHPNILTVYEIGRTDDSHFIATEFIAGETLRQRLKRTRLPLPEALDIALQIAAALKAAHEAGIIHRDIKPENIMLRPDGYVKVLDFGLAKLIEATSNPDEATTQTGMILGTPSYMSPEQARGQKVDHHTDIWSFGVVLHELVSGTRPFGGDTQADLMVAILQHPPATLPSHLPEQLQTIITRALVKDPQHRYASVNEVIEDLKTLRRKVEFASELKHAAQDNEAPTMRQTAEAVTLPLSPDLHTNAELPARNAVATLVPAAKRFPVRAVLIGVALVSMLGLSSLYIFKPRPFIPPVLLMSTPKRELTWWLTVQQMRGGKLDGTPFQSHGRDFLAPGSKFKFNLTSPQTGYLYLLNEGPTTGGKVSLNLLFPTPANNRNAAVTAHQTFQTSNYQLDTNEGVESFWIVWAANPIDEIEAVKATAKPAIQDAAQSAAILRRLNEYAPQTTIQPDESKELTKVSGEQVLAQMVKLKHR